MIGKEEQITLLLAAVFSGGHVLLEETSGIKLLISRDWESFTGKEAFNGSSRNMLFIAMKQGTSEEACPWRQMYAEEFICGSGENGRILLVRAPEDADTV